MLKDFVAFQLATEFHHRCRRLRMRDFLYEQLFRASASIAMNLAEGSGKFTPADQKRYYGIAHGSFRECEAILALERVTVDEETKGLMLRLGAILFRLGRKPGSKPGLKRSP